MRRFVVSTRVSSQRLSVGINTFCNKTRMTGMGSLCKVIGPSLSVSQSRVVFVSGGNPVREREKESKRENKSERGRWREKEFLSQMSNVGRK